MAGCRSVSSGNGQERHDSVTVFAEVMTDSNAQLSLTFTVMKADMCEHLHVCFLNDNSRHHFTYVLIYTLCWGTNVPLQLCQVGLQLVTQLITSV